MSSAKILLTPLENGLSIPVRFGERLALPEAA
jgi:hypothetical protein